MPEAGQDHVEALKAVWQLFSHLSIFSSRNMTMFDNRPVSPDVASIHQPNHE
jgi:hypothetical protein